MTRTDFLLILQAGFLEHHFLHQQKHQQNTPASVFEKIDRELGKSGGAIIQYRTGESSIPEAVSYISKRRNVGFTTFAGTNVLLWFRKENYKNTMADVLADGKHSCVVSFVPIENESRFEREIIDKALASDPVGKAVCQALS